jgi:hypothetical protein
MKLLISLAAVAGLFAATSATAATVTLNFDDQTPFASLAFPGRGFTANGALLAVPASDALGTYFLNPPSGRNAMAVVGVLPGERATLSTRGTFLDFLSFQYAAIAPFTVVVRDSLGAVLASQSFVANNAAGGAPGIWSLGRIDFRTPAAAFDFTGAEDAAFFDNVSFRVPEPATALLLALGLAGAGLARRRAA